LDRRKQVYVHTIGCQMNVYDSGRIARMATSMNYQQTQTMEEADLIIVNTCSVREKACQKAFSFMGRMAGLKRKRPEILLGVAGCMAQQEGEKLLGRPDGIDFVLGPGAIDRLPDILEKVLTQQVPAADLFMPENMPFPESEGEGADPLIPQKNRVSGFVTIMRGCDNFCSYCIVPHVRGRESSRRPEKIVGEIKRLVESGAREITLLGQNVNSYGKKDGSPSFAEMLWQVNEIKGLERIRFTTSHPKDISSQLIDCFRDMDKLCHHIHLPVQSGSNAVLKKMNRKYTRERYLETIARLKDACPDIAVTSDMIVGFPGETDEDFGDTLLLLEQVQFDGLFAFSYSDRPGTPAAGFPPEIKISEEIKKARLKRLLDAQEVYTTRKNRALVGSCQPVLTEGFSKKQASNNDCADIQWTGRTSSNKIVNFTRCHTHKTGDSHGTPQGIQPGQTVRVTIKKALSHSLWGEEMAESAGAGNQPARNEEKHAD